MRKKIIRNTEEIGRSYLLTEDIALIHGRPEQGVLKKTNGSDTGKQAS